MNDDRDYQPRLLTRRTQLLLLALICVGMIAGLVIRAMGE